DFTQGKFEEVLGAPKLSPNDKIRRIIFCSGKVYYDLLSYREKNEIKDAVIVRIEQLYPLAESKLRGMVKTFSKADKMVWCQEEPQNMGAFTFIEPRLRKLFKREIVYAGRDASASPAVGSLARHKREQALLIKEAFA
ncbi:MAG TPA: 2-oxoglutarate dehydrogenase E1 component, partial [Chthoniobacterales bacterium]